TVRNQSQEVVGGLVGATYLGWLQVHAVWLPQHLRGQGYGQTLLQLAEAEAISRGCMNATLETLSFQALPFYEKLGYQVFAQLPNLPNTESKYYLAKALTPR